jgi:excisionase family DNA binding protein
VRSITPAEAAARTGLHVETIRNYLRTGRLRAQRVGRMYLIDPKALAPLVEDKPRRGRPKGKGHGD